MMLLRHLISILLLPFMVVIMIPRWITDGAIHSEWPAGTANSIARLAGGSMFGIGFALFLWCVWLFARKGRGTLAPWDPPKEFVAEGPYRYVRNPMITGVLAMVAGQALFHRSLPVAEWAVIFLVMNQIYFMVFEEPQLERRFGESYRAYKERVPRWIPKVFG